MTPVPLLGGWLWVLHPRVLHPRVLLEQRPALPARAKPSLHLQVRRLVSDFAVILAILASCAVDAVLGLETPKLLVPSELKVPAGWAQHCQGVGLCPPW